jgi:hypothetical protein
LFSIVQIPRFPILSPVFSASEALTLTQCRPKEPFSVTQSAILIDWVGDRSHSRSYTVASHNRWCVSIYTEDISSVNVREWAGGWEDVDKRCPARDTVANNTRKSLLEIPRLRRRWLTYPPSVDFHMVFSLLILGSKGFQPGIILVLYARCPPYINLFRLGLKLATGSVRGDSRQSRLRFSPSASEDPQYNSREK